MPRASSKKSEPKLDLALPDSGFEIGLESAQIAFVEKLCKAATPTAMHALVEVAGDMKRESTPNEHDEFPVIFQKDPDDPEKMIPIRLGYSASARVAAARAIFEHGYGRPTQRVIHDGDGPSFGDVHITIVKFTEGPHPYNPAIQDVTPEKVVPVEDRSSSPLEA